MDKIGKITGGLLTLATASTISISDFESKVKSYLPQISMNQLKRDKSNISKTKKMTDAQLNVFKEELSVMKEVNLHTQSVFLPALEANFQRWAKEDLESLRDSIIWVQKALTTRIKQYEVLATLFKKSKVPSQILDQVNTLKTSSLSSQSQVKLLKLKIVVMQEAISLFKDSQKIEQEIIFEDFWVPQITTEEKNILLITEKSIQNSQDYEKINKIEQNLQKQLLVKISKSIHFSNIVLG